jgi:hypothetical protein
MAISRNVLKQLKAYAKRKGHFDKNPGGGKDARKFNIGGRANLLEEMGRLDAEKMNPNRRAEKHRVIGELNKGYKSGGRAGYATGSIVKEKRKPKFGEQPARKRKEKPVMILQTSVPEGPAKRFKTHKHFEIFKDQIDGTKIKLKKDGGRASYNSGGAIKVRDINKDGKKEGWEVARAKGMAKGMGKRLKMNSGGAVLKGKKVGCQIK